MVISSVVGGNPQYVVNVKSFGARGDGVTDDAAALQRAFTAAAGKTLIFPSNATYLVSTDITVPSNTTIIGNNATIKATNENTSNPVLMEIGNARNNIVISNLHFDGNIANIAGFNNVVTCFQTDDVVFENCTWKNCKGISLIISNCTRTGSRFGKFTDCGIFNLTSLSDADRRAGIAFTGGGEDNFALYNYMNNVGLDFISVASGEVRPFVHGNNLNTNYAGGIYVASSFQAIVTNNSITDGANSGNGIDCFFSTRCTVANNIVYGRGAAGILFADCSYMTCTGNVCFNNSRSVSSLHRGGITVAANNEATCNNITISNNVCYDNQGVGNVTQRYAIGVYQDGTGTFDNINVSANNIFSGYDSGGNFSQANIFENLGLIGVQEHPATINIATTATLRVGRDTLRGQLTVNDTGSGQVGIFALRGASNVYELVDPSAYFEITDTGTTVAVYRDSGDNTFKIKNKTAGTRTFCVYLNNVLY